jgi:outer membrane protein TolC
MKCLSLVFFASLFFVPFTGHTLTLEEGLKIVVESGRDVTIARSDEDVAREAISLARSTRLPSVELYGRETWLLNQPEARTPFGAFPTSQDQFTTYGVKATQLLYDFGRTSSSIGAAQFGLKARELETQRARNRSALDFIIAYLDLLEADKLLQVAGEEVRLHEAHKKDTEARFNAGVITRNEVLQADVTLADSRQKSLTAENLRSLKASRLNSLLLRPLNEEIRADEVKAAPASGTTLEEAWASAEAESAELKELDAKIAAREENVRLTRAEFLPTVYLSGGYEYLENRYLAHQDNWSLIAGVNVNLYSGGASSARIRMAQNEVRSLKLLRDKMLDGIRLEVKGAYLDLQSSAQRIAVARTAVAQAEENHRLQKLRYQEGVGIATEVLDAVTLLTTAETNSWKALYGFKRAEANLLHAAGKDLAGMYTK